MIMFFSRFLFFRATSTAGINNQYVRTSEMHYIENTSLLDGKILCVVPLTWNVHFIILWLTKFIELWYVYLIFLQSSWLFSHFIVIRMPRNDNYSAITQCKYLYVCLTACHVGNLSVRLSLSFVWYVCPSFVFLFFQIGVVVCLFVSVRPSARSSVRLSVHPSIHPSIHPQWPVLNWSFSFIYPIYLILLQVYSFSWKYRDSIFFKVRVNVIGWIKAKIYICFISFFASLLLPINGAYMFLNSTFKEFMAISSFGGCREWE